MIGLVLGAAFVPLALSKIESRSAEQRAQSIEHRQMLEVAASLMLQEHPLGIGPNCFISQLLHGGYGERAGLNWGQRLSIVHNIYWLTAAEMGYSGVVALVVLFLVPLASALRYGLRTRHDRRGDVLLGLGVGLMVFYAHGFIEWVWRLTEVSYVYFTIIAIVAVLTRQIEDDLAGRRRAYRTVGGENPSSEPLAPRRRLPGIPPPRRPVTRRPVASARRAGLGQRSEETTLAHLRR